MNDMGKHGKQLTHSRYPTIKSPGHPLAQGNGVVRVHRAVLYDAIGSGTHSCHWCRSDVSWGVDLVADHVDADTWNNDPSNLVPSCLPCNSSRIAESRTHCKNGHEFTEENTYWRTNKTATGVRWSRQCRACGAKRGKARTARVRKSSPARAGLTVPTRGLTLADVRRFVEQTELMGGDTPVFTTYRDSE